jgi:hypothetical protein
LRGRNTAGRRFQSPDCGVQQPGGGVRLSLEFARQGRELRPNIQGPSLIRVRDWIPDRLGHYYLYFFADHKEATSGWYIRIT